MFYRKAKIKVKFDMYRITGAVFLGTFEKEEEVEQDPKYDSREEAIRLDGTLEEWAENVAKLTALTLAAGWVGADVPEDLDTTTVTGNTFEARNIVGTYSEEEEGEEEVELPEYVKRTIADLEKRKAEAKTTERKEKIQKTIDELKKEFGKKTE